MGNKKKCQEYREQLALKQYHLSKYDINGTRGLHEMKILIKHIHAILEELEKLRCSGVEYLEPEPEPRKTTSTQLKLRRASDPKKLLIPNGNELKKYKKFSVSNIITSKKK